MADCYPEKIMSLSQYANFLRRTCTYSDSTLGASLIVKGVGIVTAVAGGVTVGVSNITKMVNKHTNRQKIKLIITELQ